VERVLPHATVKERISALTVGVAIDWYSAGPEIEELFAKNLPDPRNAPMVGFLTADGAWVDGFSGWITETDFVKVLERVEQSPLLLATPAVRKRLEKHAATVGPAAEQGNWRVVLAAAREAGKSTGRCPERDAIAAAEKQARTWAAGELDGVVQEAKTGGDLVPLRKRLRVVKDKFAGEPEAADVDTGMAALKKLALVREVEAAGNPARDLRERHAEPFKDTRWVALFDRLPAASEPK